MTYIYRGGILFLRLIFASFPNLREDSLIGRKINCTFTIVANQFHERIRGIERKKIPEVANTDDQTCFVGSKAT